MDVALAGSQPVEFVGVGHEAGRDTRLLGLELDLSQFDEAVQSFCARCDQAVANDASIQTYVRQLEQDYDAAADEEPRALRDEDLNPEKLIQELEDFLREEREGGAE